MRKFVLTLLMVLLLSIMETSLAENPGYVTIIVNTASQNSIDDQTIADQGMYYWIVDLNIQNNISDLFRVDPKSFFVTANNKNYTIDQATSNLGSLDKIPLLYPIYVEPGYSAIRSLAFMIPYGNTQIGNTRPKLSYMKEDIPIVWKVEEPLAPD
jgi:hypothetical protein